MSEKLFAKLQAMRKALSTHSLHEPEEDYRLDESIPF
jgi:primosomal protein N''